MDINEAIEILEEYTSMPRDIVSFAKVPSRDDVKEAWEIVCSTLYGYMYGSV